LLHEEVLAFPVVLLFLVRSFSLCCYSDRKNVTCR